MDTIHGVGDKRRHIVIVDDDPVNLQLAENVLSAHYKLTKLISGRQLLQLLERVIPDMILLDIQMPDMDGYEVLKNVQENEAAGKIPVIFLTGQRDIDSEREGFRLGAKDFITKPFDNEVMLGRVRSQMELYIYRTRLEEIVEQKTNQIFDLQHMLTVSWAEMIESRDGTTGNHVRNTTAYYGLFLNALQKKKAYAKVFTEDALPDLMRASTLHDIGKIDISDTILKKPGPLTPEEFDLMKKHSRIGANMIETIIIDTYAENFLALAWDMALFHHERWNGTGYPCEIKGESIPIYVRALSIADVYDALTSVRPYKKAFSHEEALAIMQNDCGEFFDPDLFEVFVQEQDVIKNMPKNVPAKKGKRE